MPLIFLRDSDRDDSVRSIDFVSGQDQGKGLTIRLELFLDKRQHIAIVVGEYGETQGLVTMEDVIETLLGFEIVDEGDKIEDMQQLARKLWRKRAESLGLDKTQEPRAQSTRDPDSQITRKRNKRLEFADAKT